MTMRNAALPEHLWQCQGAGAQVRWVRRALEQGRVLSEAELWLAGVDQPENLIQRLRREGLAVQDTVKTVVDAADISHQDRAWRLGA
jgi:folate-dependent phosphoribosylglycinamide formyltransferase PurN